MKFISKFIFCIVLIGFLCIPSHSANIFNLTTDYEKEDTRTNNTTEIDIDEVVVEGKVSMPDVSCSTFFDADKYKELDIGLENFLNQFLKQIQGLLDDDDAKNMLKTELVNKVVKGAADEYARQVCTKEILNSINSGELVVNVTEKRDRNMLPSSTEGVAGPAVSTIARRSPEIINLSGDAYECLKSIALQSDRGDRLDLEAGTWIPPKWPPHPEPWVHAGLPMRSISGIGDMVGLLLKSQESCANQFESEFKNEQYDQCMTRERKKFIEMTNDLLNSKHNFQIEETIRLHEECLLDQAQRETDLGYLIHGSDQNTLTYNSDGNPTVSNAKDFQHKTIKSPLGIRLPNGAIMDIRSGDFRFVQTDDFLTQEEREIALTKVTNQFYGTDNSSDTKAWKDFMIYNILSSIVVVSDVDNRQGDYYSAKFSQLSKDAEYYEKNILKGIFKDADNKIYSLDKIIKNCMTTLNFIENRYRNIIMSPQKTDLLINPKYDVYYTVDLLKVYNDTTHYFCSNYIREYKTDLLNYIGEYNGFIQIDEDLRTNKEFMQIINMNFEKMQKQVQLLASNKELIDKKYRDIENLYTAPIGYFKSASFSPDIPNNGGGVNEQNK